MPRTPPGPEHAGADRRVFGARGEALSALRYRHTRAGRAGGSSAQQGSAHRPLRSSQLHVRDARTAHLGHASCIDGMCSHCTKDMHALHNGHGSAAPWTCIHPSRTCIHSSQDLHPLRLVHASNPPGHASTPPRTCSTTSRTCIHYLQDMHPLPPGHASTSPQYLLHSLRAWHSLRPGQASTTSRTCMLHVPDERTRQPGRHACALRTRFSIRASRAMGAHANCATAARRANARRAGVAAARITEQPGWPATRDPARPERTCVSRISPCMCSS